MNKKGFTLIEVMIVVCIICILLAILIPQYQATKHRNDRCRDDMVQSISNINKVDVIDSDTVVIHTANASYTYTPVDFKKGTKINYTHTEVYHRVSDGRYCHELYYFGQGN